MHAAFVRRRLRRLKALQEPLQVERMTQELAGALLGKDRRRLQSREIQLPRCRAALLSPKQGAGEGAILYLHGGGYCCGDLTYACGYGSVLSADGAAHTLCPAYRLAPESPFPAALEDALDAYRFLLDRCSAK